MSRTGVTVVALRSARGLQHNR